jgi:RES domain-containing protein
MPGVEPMLERLAKLTPRKLARRLVRCVARDFLESQHPPAFLFTSGKPNRYNPEFVHCVYFSENLEIAALEYARPQKAAGFTPVPFTIYFADAKLPILDLANPRTVAALGLVPADLHAPWRLRKTITKTQILGAAIARQKRFAGIRYPSDAARTTGKAGCNYVIFRDSLKAPASLRVLTGKLVPVQHWP